MAQWARVATSILLAVLVVLEATPGISRGEVRSPARRSEIAGSIEPVTLLALPSKRTASVAEPSGFGRIPLPSFAFAPRAPVRVERSRLGDASLARFGCGGATWFQVRRQRARSPDDPDPS